MPKYTTLNVTTPENLDTAAKGLYDLLKSHQDEVIGNNELYAAFLSLACVKYEQQNPFLMLFYKQTANLSETCLSLGYILAKYPDEIQALLDKLAGEMGTMEISDGWDTPEN